jgi:hypothetical protein
MLATGRHSSAKELFIQQHGDEKQDDNGKKSVRLSKRFS